MFIKKIIHRKMSRALLLILGFFACAIAQAANITASVDRDSISLKETVTLTIKVDEQTKSAPDFSSLKSDFDILSSQRSSSIQVVNGSAESSTDWQLTLAPKHAGTLLIPSFNIGNDVSDAIEITVSSQGQNQNQIATDDNEQVRATIEVNKSSAYVQEQILVKIKLITEVNLSQAEMQPLELKNALVINLDQKQYQTNINGTPHLIVETSFAIFPQESGELVIPSLLYTVSVDNMRSVWGDPFGRNRGSVLRLRTDEQRINVKAVPTQIANQPWQPANQLSLTETWSASLSSAKIGEPITRTITITTDGLTAGQIAPLENTNVNGLTFYPDQAQTKDNKSENGVQGSRTETTAIVPNSGGDFVLPPVDVSWWNNATQQLETASLPAKTIHVLGQPAIATTSAAAVVPDLTSTQSTLSTDSPASESSTTVLPLWALVIIAFFVVLSAAFAFYSWKLKSAIRALHEDQRNHVVASLQKEKDIWDALKTAAAASDAAAFRKAVLQWAHIQWPEQKIATLDDIATLGMNPALTQELQALDKVLYGNQDAAPWDATTLLKLMNDYRKQKKAGKKSPELQNLYNQ